MYIFLLFICSSISSLYGQDFLSNLPEEMFYNHILPELVITEKHNQDHLNYIAYLVGYIEQAEYPELSKCPELDNERLIKKSQSTNAPLTNLKRTNKALKQHITIYEKLFKNHIKKMIPQDCTLQEVLRAYPFTKNNRSYFISLPDQIDLPWSRVFNWRITRMRDVFSRISLEFFNDNNPYDIQIRILRSYCDGCWQEGHTCENCWESHKKIVHDARSSEKTVTEKCTSMINFLDNSIELLKKKNSYFCKRQEEAINSLRTFCYILNSYNKDITKIDGDRFDITSPYQSIYLKLKKFNSLDNQNEIISDDTAFMSPADIYELYKAMLGLF